MLEVEHLQSQLEMSSEKVMMLKEARAKDADKASKKNEDLFRQNKNLI